MLESFSAADYLWENDLEIFNRGKEFKKFLKEYLTKNPLPTGEKLGIICHSKFICSLTSTNCIANDEKFELVNGALLKNCQTIAWNNF